MNRRPIPPYGLEALESRILLDASLTFEPSPYAQYMLQLINYVRAHPTTAASSYGVGLNEGMTAGTISADAKQPLAFNTSLVYIARYHDLWMLGANTYANIETDGPYAAQTPGQRMQSVIPTLDAGNTGENIDYLSASPPSAFEPISGTRSLLRDMFLDSTTLGRWRRLNLMDPNFKEIGVAVNTVNTGDFLGGNAILTTQDFALESGDSFLTGVVYDDHSVTRDKFYTPGEGLGGVTVTATTLDGLNTYTVPTWSAGGYSLQVPDGTYSLTFSGGSLTQQYLIPAVVVNGQNVEKDLDTANPPPQIDLKVTNPAKQIIYVRPGLTFDYTPAVANAGKLADGQSFTVSIYRSDTSSVTSSDTLWTSYGLSSLGAGKTNKTKLTLTAPSTPGVYYFSVMADSANRVFESNESNNWSNVVKAVVGDADLQPVITKTTFTGAIVPGDRGQIQFKLQNLGTIPAKGKIDLQIWATAAEGAPQPDDVQLATLSDRSINIAPKDNRGNSVTITTTVPLSDALPQGDWHITVVANTGASPLPENDTANNIASTIESHTLVWQFGDFSGRKNVKLVLHDSLATPVTFSLTGDGYGVVSGGATFDELVLHDTTAQSNFKAATPKNVHVSVGNLSVLGHVKSVAGAVLDVRGNVEVEGGVATLSLGNLDHPADQQVLLHSDNALTINPKLQTTVSLGYVRNVVFNANDLPLRSLSLVEWTDDAGSADTLSAAALGSLSAKGRKATRILPKIDGDFAPALTIDHAVGKARVAGDVSAAWSAEKINSLKVGGNLSGDLTLDLPLAAKGSDLGSLSVGGWIQNSKIRAAGSIGNVTAGGIDSALIFAGLDLGSTALPVAFSTQAAIRSVTIKGTVSSGGFNVIRPLISAYTLGSVSLRYAAPAGGETWGLATHTLSSFTYRSDGLSYSWPNRSDVEPIVPVDMTVNII